MTTSLPRIPLPKQARRTERRSRPRIRNSVTLRAGIPTDDEAIRRLAELDSAEALSGPVLIAEVEGRALAAISLESRRVIADPFELTAHLTELLRNRAAQIASTERSASPRYRIPMPRRAARAALRS